MQVTGTVYSFLVPLIRTKKLNAINEINFFLDIFYCKLYSYIFKIKIKFLFLCVICISETMINGQEIPKMVLVKVINRHTMAPLAWSPMGSSNPTGML